MHRIFLLLSVVAGLVPAGQVAAHSFGQTYTLPVPIWLYLYGAGAALLVSFIVAGYFIKAPATSTYLREIDLTGSRFGGWLVKSRLLICLRALSVCLFMATLLAGFLGNNEPYRNINMTLFWIVFCLGYTYLTALLGDWFGVLSPFRVIVEQLERFAPKLFSGLRPYPQVLAYWPALILYIGFIWLELFGRSTPYVLSTTLLCYLLINLAGCVLVGKRAWFQYCEFFAVFLRMVGKIAPIRCVAGNKGAVTGLVLRAPGAGLIQQRRVPISLLVFILFMLSSTAFDGLHETALWIGAFWENLYQGLLFPLYGENPPVTFPLIKKLFLVYQTTALILSPLFYLAVFAFFMVLAKVLVRSRLSLNTLLTWFGCSLIPIVVAYHFTHYYTLLQVQGAKLVQLVSDPLGLGWNLFGTAASPMNVIPDMGVVWHTQVFVIVVGHMVSVYLSHVQALRVFGSRREAVLSQLPILILMLAFTTIGLWILSLPHAAAVPG